MSTHSDDHLIDTLRAVLRRFESDSAHDPQSVDELKRILRARIAELEAAERSRVDSQLRFRTE